MLDSSSATYEWAKWWASQGWIVFPVCSPRMEAHEHHGILCEGKNLGKQPLTKNGFKDGSTRLNKTEASFRYEYPLANIGATPPEGCVVIDEDECDSSIDWPETLTFRTSRGRHLVYRDTRQCVPQTQSGSQLVPGYDTRVSGKGYIVLPPSVHASGHVYEVMTDVPIAGFPYDLFSPDTFKQGTKGTKTPIRKPGKGSLPQLLSQAIDDPTCGDDWMTSVAGHVATFAPTVDIWWTLINKINSTLAEPLSELGMAKKRGIWEAEQAKKLNGVSPENGWLVEWSQSGYGTEVGKGDNIEVVPWSDFKVKAKEVVIYEDRQIWLVDFVRPDGSILEDQELPSEVLASHSALVKYMHNRGLTLTAPRRDERTAHGARLLIHMRNQNPKQVTAVDYFGWSFDLQGFVTPTHIIKADEIEERRTVLSVKDDDIYYGICDPEKAKEALRTFLSFQDPKVMYVLGAWLMMLYLKEQEKYKHPSLALEGFAGSAKTVIGEVLCQLAGAMRKGGKLTLPVTRDKFSLSPNTLVWVDDVHMDDHLQELFRAACTDGEYSLMSMRGIPGEVKKVPLLASAFVSAESIPWVKQKAIRDRFLLLSMPVLPGGEEGRESLARWKTFKRTYDNDLRTVAGTLVQLALQKTDMLSQLTTLAPDNTRMGQGIGVLRVGARILSAILEDPKYAIIVDAVLVEHNTDDQSSLVTHEVIPTVWRLNGFPESAGDNGLFLPVFRDRVTGRFWVNAEKLQDSWWSHNRGYSERERSLTSATAITRELTSCGASESAMKRTTGDRKCLRYREIPDKYSALILLASGVEI